MQPTPIFVEIDNYRKLLGAFTDNFSDVDRLKNVGQERLVILAETGRISCNADAFASLLVDISKKESLKLELVVYVLKAGLDDHSTITHLLTSLKSAYPEVCDREKRVKLSNNDLNRQLLEALQKVGFISSFKEENEQLRVYHKIQK